MSLPQPELRELLSQHLLTDADRRAFVLDNFPDVARRASATLDAQSLWNLLFELHDTHEVADALHRQIRESMGAAPGVRSVPGFHLPPLDPWFSGRTEALAEVERLLVAQRGLTLRGLGGLGKSSLARRYLHRNRHRFSFVGWLCAADAGSLIGGYVALAGFLSQHGLSRHPAPSPTDPQARLAFVLAELAHLSDWLLVLDNADHPEALELLWPSIEHGFVLVTSRHPEPGRFPVYELPPWNLEEALSFLRRRTGQTLTGSAEAAARAILKEVEALPLAVEQIGAYLAQHQTPMERYLPALQKEHSRLFQSHPGMERRSITTVWSLSFSEVEAESPAAADLLRVSAYLSPDGIPERFLTAGAAELGKPLHTALSQETSLAIDVVLGPLLRHSLVRRFQEEDGESFYSVHRLVQDVIRQRLRSSQQEAIFIRRAVAALSQVFPDPAEATAWVRSRALLPSVESLWLRAQMLELLPAARLWSLAGYYLMRQARYTEAEPLFRRSLEIREKALKFDHPDVATSLSDMALLLTHQGKLTEAEPLCRRSLKISQEILDPDHPHVAIRLNNLAALLTQQSKEAEAEPLYRRSLAILEKALKPDDPDVGLGLNNLAALLASQGKLDEAEPLYRRSLAIGEKALGLDHPDVATSLHNLAAALCDQGKLDEAEPLYRRSLAIGEKALRSDHPNVASTLNSLAFLLAKRGKFAEAERLYHRSLAIYEKTLGPDHPDVASILLNMALLLFDQTKFSEAELLCRRSLAIFEKALGPDHPDVALCLHTLAVLLDSIGRLAEAEPLYRRSLTLAEKELGPDHPSTKIARENLRLLLKNQEGCAGPMGE